MTGHWLDELVDAVAHELDEPDANGYTPLMHAILYGQSQVALKLIEKEVACDDQVPPKEPGAPPRTMLMVAIQNVVTRPNESEEERKLSLEVISANPGALLTAGVVVMVPMGVVQLLLEECTSNDGGSFAGMY